VQAVDLNNDGKIDLVTADYEWNRVGVLYGLGNGTFGPATSYGPNIGLNGNPVSVTIGDFNGDGRPDIAVSAYANNSSGNQVYLLTGDAAQPLTEDPTGSGLRSGYGRGNLWSTSDADYWSFTANAGDTLKVAADIPGSPSASQLYYVVYDPAGNQLTSFYNGNSNGQGGESSPIVLSAPGTYQVLVRYNYDYEGEYRIRVTLAAPGTQVESESNDSIASANVPTLALTSPGHVTATMAGSINTNDGGDYFKLGNITAGVGITLGETQPSTSLLSDVLAIVKSDGTVLATSAAGAASLSYTIPSGGDGAYYARVTAASGTAGLLSQYLLLIDLADTIPPTITSVNLPSEGTTS